MCGFNCFKLSWVLLYLEKKQCEIKWAHIFALKMDFFASSVSYPDLVSPFPAILPFNLGRGLCYSKPLVWKSSSASSSWPFKVYSTVLYLWMWMCGFVLQMTLVEPSIFLATIKKPETLFACLFLQVVLLSELSPQILKVNGCLFQWDLLWWLSQQIVCMPCWWPLIFQASLFEL